MSADPTSTFFPLALVCSTDGLCFMADLNSALTGDGRVSREGGRGGCGAVTGGAMSEDETAAWQ